MLLSRWDVLWQTPFLEVARLPGWHARSELRLSKVWLPRICTPIEPHGNVGIALRGGVCGGTASTWLASQAAKECSRAAVRIHAIAPPRRPCRPQLDLQTVLAEGPADLPSRVSAYCSAPVRAT